MAPRIASVRSNRLRRNLFPGILGLAPAFVFVSVAFVYPIVAFSRRSLFDPQFTLEHYQRIIDEPVYLTVLWITFKISLLVTFLTCILGYPIAYAAYRAKRKWIKWLILTAVIVPFWTSLLVRTFAFMMLLQRQGVVNDILINLRIVSEPVPMVYNLTGVLVGMTYMLLPYLVLPLYSVMDRVNPLLEVSALGLGANRVRAFFSTVFPLSFPGLLAGASLVFLLSLGFFVTPALLGGRKEQMLSMVIESQVNELLNWGFASALSVLLIAVTLSFGMLLFAATRFLAKRAAAPETLYRGMP